MAAIAAVMADSGAELPYSELDRRSIQLSHLLRAGGLAAGDRVAILLENRLDWYVAMWGIRRAGMLFVPMNWHLTPTEIRYVLDDSDSRAIITSPLLADVARQASEGLEGLSLRLCCGTAPSDFVALDEALGQYPQEPAVHEPDGTSMLYSSGTTGYPKGILRPPENLTFGQPSSLETMIVARYSIDAETVYLSPAPMYHAAPIGFTGTVLRQHGTIVLMEAFDPEATLRAIERYRVTHVQFVPTHFVRMLRLPAETRARYDLSSLKRVIHAAAPCAPDVKRAMIDWMGPIVSEYYAGSEGCGATFIESEDWLAHPGSVGRSPDNPIHIVDPETGEELPTGEIGTIYFEGSPGFTYHKAPEKTAAARTAKGWATLGDVGSVDADGYLYLADRRSDMILSGGVNIYPLEIENALALHPAVADVAVVGLPDPEFGQVVCAVIQLLPDSPPPSPREIIDFARQRLATFKAPRSVVFTDALPRLPSGKLLRRRVLEQQLATKELV